MIPDKIDEIEERERVRQARQRTVRIKFPWGWHEYVTEEGTVETRCINCLMVVDDRCHCPGCGLDMRLVERTWQ